MNPFSLPKSGAEISDRIVHFDPESLDRLPVRKADVVNEFLAAGNRRAARIVQRLPDRGGVLDPGTMDRLLITAHCEMQRLSEEFQHGHRMFELLNPLVTAIRPHVIGPIRIVDIGCGTGFVIRWLAANANFSGGVELIGVDYNPALVGEARRLAEIERIECSFLVANAFRMADAASIFVSTGVLHHFRGDDLTRFFEQHNEPRACAFVHWDFQPSPLAAFGSWLFHEARMREPLSKHDGVLSAARTYSADTLLRAARSGAPDYLSAIYSARLWRLPVKRVFHCVLGIRPAYKDAFIAASGARASRLGEMR